jgi:hypothetical protein
MKKEMKGMLLMIAVDTHKRIEKEVLKKGGWSKTQWVREAIAEKLDKRKSK